MNRNLLDRCKEEIIAELGSFFLAEKFNIHSCSIKNYGFNLIKAHYIGGDLNKKDLIECINHAIDAVRFIIKK